MLNIATRTSEEQAETIAELVRHGAVIHSLKHNLDGLWVNLEYTIDGQDWISSINRNGEIETTQ